MVEVWGRESPRLVPDALTISLHCFSEQSSATSSEHLRLAGGTPPPPVHAGWEAQPWVGGARGPVLDIKPTRGNFSGAAVLQVLWTLRHPDLPQHAPDCGGETPDRGVAPTAVWEQTGEGAHTQRRGARAPLQAEAHRRPERGWVQLEDIAPSSGPRLREKGGPTRGRGTPEGSGPHPWPPTCASRCLNRFTAPRPRAAQKNRGGGGFLPFWSLLPREAPGVRAARLRTVRPGRAALLAPANSDPATHAAGHPFRPGPGNDAES